MTSNRDIAKYVDLLEQHGVSALFVHDSQTPELHSPELYSRKRVAVEPVTNVDDVKVVPEAKAVAVDSFDDDLDNLEGMTLKDDKNTDANVLKSAKKSSMHLGIFSPQCGSLFSPGSV